MQQLLPPHLLHLVENIQDTLRKSLLDPNLKLSALRTMYDELYLETHLDFTELAEFAECNYGQLLDHAREVESLPIPNRPIVPSATILDQPRQPPRKSGLVNLDTNPIFSNCLAVSSIAIRITMETLLVELQEALYGYPVDWPRFVSSLEDLIFMTTQPHGNQFTVLVHLLQSTAFHMHPIGSQFGIAAVVYGHQQSSRAAKSYSSRYSVQVSPTSSASELACSRYIAAAAWGSDGAVSEQLQHTTLHEHLVTTLTAEDRTKVMIITSRVVIPNVKPTIRMSMTVYYLLRPGEKPQNELKRLYSLLFGKDNILTVHGIPFAIFHSPDEALVVRPKCKSLAPLNILTVSGLKYSVPVSEVVETLLRSGALQLRATAWVYTARNFSVKGKDLRYLFILGQAVVGQLNGNDPIFEHIATRGAYRYDLRVVAGELFGQLELRLAHQASLNPVQIKAPIPSTTTSALVKRSKSDDRASAWPTTSLEKYSAPDSTTTNQLTSGVLAMHTEEIKQIQNSLKGIESKLEQHDQVLRTVATKDELEAILAKFLKPAV